MAESRVWPWRVFTLGAALFLSATVARAQATRTWVSGVGDDANPCSRTAPCKTFAGAISKTVAGGEINVLDPGGFGGVTITKSISIEAVGLMAGVLVAGTNAIVINAGANDIVVLRGLTIEGLGSGLNGIRFLAGGTLHVENCTINRFSQYGIDFAPNQATSSRLFVKDTNIRGNGAVSPFSGIVIKPTGGGSVLASIDHTRFEHNLSGLRVEDNSVATVRDSVSAGNTFAGFSVVTVGGGATLNLESSEAIGNGGQGVKSQGATAAVVLSNMRIAANGTGLLSLGGGQIISFGNNHVAGNGTDGSPTATIPSN